MGRAAIPVVEAEVTLLSTEEGGRSSALRLDHPTAFYRPHVVVGDVHQRRAIIGPDRFITEEYLGVQFRRSDLVCTAPGFLDTRGGYQDSAPTLDRRS
jgi:hypothetical protein